jgi:hypothetical protein
METITITVHHFVTAVTVVLTLTALIIASVAVSGHIDWRDDSIPDTAIKVQDQNMDLALFLKNADPSFFNATAVQVEDGGLAAIPASSIDAVHHSDLKHLRGHNAEVTSSGAHTVVDEDGLALKSGSGNYTLLKAFNNVTSSYTLTFPATTGTANQVLKTDGSGNLSFGDVTGLTLTTDNLGNGSNALNLSIPNTLSIGNTGGTDFTLSTAGNIIMDSTGDITLDADGDNIYFKFGGVTGQMQVTNENSGDVVIQSQIDGKDLVFKQYDGTETLRLTDTAEVEVKDNLHLKSDAAVLYFGADSEYSITHANNNGLTFAGPTLTTSTTDDYALKLTQTLNNALGTGATEVYTMLEANLTETDASGWDNVYLMDLRSGTSKFSVNNSGNTSVAGTMGVSGALTASTTLNVTGEATFGSHVNLGDNDILKIGPGPDLQIYHNSINSYITNGTGDLVINGSSGALTLSGGGGVTVTSTGGTLSLNGTGQTVNIDAATLDVDTSGVISLVSTNNSITINSGTGSINISSDASASTVNVGTGGAVKTCNIGSTNGASITTIQSGTGGIINKRTVQTITDSANDATAAEYVAGFINCTGGGANTWTLPTGPVLADAMPGASVSVGDSFTCHVVNSSGGDITYAAAAGCTLSSSGAGTLAQKDDSMAKLEFVFTVATDGSEEYHCLLIADNA